MGQDLNRVRTHLANERTLLAYIRTGLGFFAAGLAAVGLLERAVFHGVGAGLMALGGVVILIGVYRFARVRTGVDRRDVDSDA